MDNFQQTNVDLQSLVMSNGVSESFEKRMQILEMENGRLMKCQGQIIKETNRKLEVCVYCILYVHLEIFANCHVYTLCVALYQREPVSSICI